MERNGRSGRNRLRVGLAAIAVSWGLLALTGCLGNIQSQNSNGHYDEAQGRFGGHGSCSDGSCGQASCGTCRARFSHGSCGDGTCGQQGCSTCGGHGKLFGNLGHGKLGQKICGAPYQPPNQGEPPHGPFCPRELQKVSHPPHKLAPPDIVVINAIRMIPRPPYRIEPLEALLVFVPDTDTLPKQPISGPYTVSLDGTINLGYGYGAVIVGGKTPDEAQVAIRRHLAGILKNNPQVNVSLAQFRGMEQIRGEHLIRPDGTISLGSYGAVYVAGLSLGQAKCVIEKHLSEYLVNPQISIDVFAYNSRVYYIIIDGAGYGQQVFRMPSTGNETVLDAIAAIQGLATVSSKNHIHLARPSPVQMGCSQILPIDWQAITQGASTATNYQIFPGDRIYVGANCLIALDNAMAQMLAPVERILGITLLASSVKNNLSGNSNGSTGVIVGR